MKLVKKIVKWSVFSIFILGLLVSAAVSLYVFITIKTAPTISKSELSSDGSTRIYDANNNLIYQTTATQRDYIHYKDIPKTYINALVSTENRSFFTDSGINVKNIVGSAVSILKGGEFRGGSTLTQQLVKLTAFSTSSSDRTIKRKIQEAYLALQLTKIYSKKQILEYYVNKVFEGQGVYGAETISEVYFNKPLKDLDLSQTAIIAGLGQSPTTYNLYTNPKLVRTRRDEVLASMYSNHKITKSDYKKALDEDVKTGLQPADSRYENEVKNMKVNSGYISSVIEQAESLGFKPNKNGLIIKTSLNQTVQNKVYTTLNTSSQYEGINGVQAAATVVDNKTGNVIAQIGGRNLTEKSMFGINRATQTNRSTGSSTKPLVDYGPAIEYLGWGTNHILEDTPYVYPGTNIHLYDYSMSYAGAITMLKALQWSLNIPAVRTLDAVGGANASKFLTRIGIANKGASLGGTDAIGINTSTAALASGYATVANNGYHYPISYITSIETPNQKLYVIRKLKAYKGYQAIKDSTAYVLTSLMKTNISEGTSDGAKISGLTQAGKDGMVGYDSSADVPDRAVEDAWMAGFTKGITLAVWDGYDSPLKPNSYIPESKEEISTNVYKEIMSSIGWSFDHSDWKQPSDLTKSGDYYIPKATTVTAKKTVSIGSAPAIASSTPNWGILQAPASADLNDNGTITKKERRLYKKYFKLTGQKANKKKLKKKIAKDNSASTKLQKQIDSLNTQIANVQAQISSAQSEGK